MLILGAGRVGGALALHARLHGAPFQLIDRHHGWDALTETSGPVLVAVRNDDLPAVLARVPPVRHRDLVFLQNGMLRPWLADVGLTRATRGLLFFAVPHRGAALDPGGTSLFHGPHAEVVVAWLGVLEVPAAAVSERAFAIAELEKLVWNSAFGLLCEGLEAAVGDIVASHQAETDALLDELVRLGDQALALGLDAAERDAMKARLVAYSRSIADYRGAVKEWRWRNGWFVDAARDLAAPAPEHERWLRQTGHLQ